MSKINRYLFFWGDCTESTIEGEKGEAWLLKYTKRVNM